MRSMREMKGKDWDIFRRFIKTLNNIGIPMYELWKYETAQRIWQIWECKNVQQDEDKTRRATTHSN